MSGVDSLYRSEQFVVFLRAPVHKQIAFDRGSFGNVRINQMSGKIKMALFCVFRGVGVELIVPELDLFQLPTFALKLSDKIFPRGIPERAVGSGRFDEFDAVREQFRLLPFGHQELAELKLRKNVEFIGCGIDRIPEGLESAAAFLGQDFRGPDRLVHLLFLGFDGR